MGFLLSELGTVYGSALLAYMNERSESALLSAGAIGRQALASGLGVLDMVTIHHASLAAALCAGVAEMERRGSLTAATAFLCEALSPFEMVYRAFQDTTGSSGRGKGRAGG